MTDWKPISGATFDGREVLVAGVGSLGPFRMVAKLAVNGKVYQFDPLGSGYSVETEAAGLLWQELPDYPNSFAILSADAPHSARRRAL